LQKASDRGPEIVQSRTDATLGDVAAERETKRWRTWLPVPLANLICLAVHWLVSKTEPAAETRSYFVFLWNFLAVALLLAIAQLWLPALRRRMREAGPIFAAALLMVVRLGTDHDRLSLVAAAVLPEPGECFPKSDQRSRAPLRQHLAFAGAVARRLRARRHCGTDQRHLHWVVDAGPLLGHADPESGGAHSRHRLDSARDGGRSIDQACFHRPRGPGRVVPGDHAHGLGNFEYTRASYLDVARTLGASPSYLIFRVAIPAAMPRRAQRVREVDAAADGRGAGRAGRGGAVVGGELIAGPSAERGLVFQDPNLFPWLTVRRNVQAGLVARGVLAREAARGGRVPRSSSA
jgi:hypothetical protein